MKLDFYRDGTGFFPKYLKKRYEKELSCYQILKFEIGKYASENSKSSDFVVGFSLRHKESGCLACLIFNPMEMSCDIKQTDFPCFDFSENQKLSVSGKFVFGSLQFRGDICSLFVAWPCDFYCENLEELKELMEFYALLSGDEILIEAVSTNELPLPVIFDSFCSYAYFLRNGKALVVSRGEFSCGKSVTFCLKNNNPESCFYIVDKEVIVLPARKLYQQSDGKYFYFDGNRFCPRRGKYITEKEVLLMKESLSIDYPDASFWKRPLPCRLGWLVGAIRRLNALAYLTVELYSGNVELLYPDEVSFPADPGDKRFIYAD